MSHVPRRFLIYLLFMLGAISHLLGQTAEPRCLSYEPQATTIQGRLVRRAYPGPPDYTSISSGDQAETYWLVKLPQPACVNEDKSDADLSPAQSNLTLVQLVFTDPSEYKVYASFVGKQVVAKGTLFGAISGHHHTPVLLTVLSLSPKL